MRKITISELIKKQPLTLDEIHMKVTNSWPKDCIKKELDFLIQINSVKLNKNKYLKNIR